MDAYALCPLDAGWCRGAEVQWTGAAVVQWCRQTVKLKRWDVKGGI